MKCRTSELPGIGKKLTFVTAENSSIVLIVHHTGKREMYFFDDADQDEADFAIDLTGEETRELGAQLLGAMYQPADIDKMSLIRGQIVIEWIELKQTSPLDNKTILQSQIRTKTGASIIGIIKGEEVVAVPDVDIVLHAGDTLMCVGKREQIIAMTVLCNGEEIN